MTKPVNASYDTWRAGIPFTDDQFAAAFEQAANEIDGESTFLAQKYRWRAGRCRQGFVSSADLRLVLDRLITQCALCGKKALYRQGVEGRCSSHRLVPQRHVSQRRVRMETRSTERERSTREFDRSDSRRRAATGTMKFGDKKPKA